MFSAPRTRRRSGLPTAPRSRADHTGGVQPCQELSSTIKPLIGRFNCGRSGHARCRRGRRGACAGRAHNQACERRRVWFNAWPSTRRWPHAAPHYVLFFAALHVGLYRPPAVHGHRRPPRPRGELQTGRAHRRLCGDRRPAAGQAACGPPALPHGRAAALARQARPEFHAQTGVLAVRCHARRSLRDRRRRQGHRSRRVSGNAFAAVWEGQRNLAEEATLLELAATAQLPGAELVALARAETTAAAYAQNTGEAIAASAFGSPCFVLDDEVFWGQDRLELLDDALASGRAAYRP